MKSGTDKKTRKSLNMKTIFRCMMEEGYYPTYEKTHISFGIDDNLATVEYDEGILKIRLFFSVEPETYELYLEAGNETMVKTDCVKPFILEDMEHLIFSCELLCDNIRDFRRFFPRGVALLTESLEQHKNETRRLLLASEIISKSIPATDEFTSMTGNIKANKIFS